jgi:iron complex transport system substrate-binding protein
MIAGSRWVSELIEIAGGVDVFADRSGGRKALERVVESDEVLERRPDVILASWCGKPFEPATLSARPGWRDLPAVAAGRVHEVDAALILQPGPAALTDGLAVLERLLENSG